jgi:hypothetical protein
VRSALGRAGLLPLAVDRLLRPICASNRSGEQRDRLIRERDGCQPVRIGENPPACTGPVIFGADKWLDYFR